MTTTKSIRNVIETPDTIEVPFLDRTNLKELGNSTSPDGLTREKVWQYAAGDEDFPMTLRAAVYVKPTANDGLGEVVSTYKIATYATEVDDTSGEIIWSGPVTASLTVKVPGPSAAVDSDDFLALVANLYTAYFAGVDGSNIPTTTVVDQLKFNIPAIS